MNNPDLEHQTDALQNISAVTPKAKLDFFKSTVFQVVLVVCLLFLSMAYFAKAPSARTKERDRESLSSNPQGLKDNLSRLAKLKEDEAAHKAHEQEAMMKALIAARQSPNYTATADGQKIGNPASFRDRPLFKKKEDKALEARMAAKTTFFNRQGTAVTNEQTQLSASFKGEGQQTGFLNQSSKIAFAKASRLSHPEYLLTAGMSIDATLEVAVNSQLPGMVRAITRQDIYSSDASHLLIPKGSQLVGQYDASGITAAQDRLLIAWTRVKLPDGIIAELDSPSTDSLGRTGLKADSIDRHLFERFGTAAFFSVLGAYTANAGVDGMDNYNSAAQYRMSVVNGFQQTASQALKENASIKQTLSNYQGKPIAVMVARDISFYDVLNHKESYK